MPSTASFTRQTIGEETVFVVTRARYPITVSVISFLFLSPMLVEPILALLFIALLVYRVWKMVVDGRPFPIRLSPQGLRFGTHVVPLADIADLSVTGPSGVEVASSTFVVGGTGVVGVTMAATAAIAHNAGQIATHTLVFLINRVAARKLELRVRRRSFSRPIRIIKGLTAEAAEALMGDLTAEIEAQFASLAAASWALQAAPAWSPPAMPAPPPQQWSSWNHGQDAGSSAPSSRTAVAVPDMAARDGRTVCAPLGATMMLRFTSGPLAGQVMPVGPSTIIGREASVAKIVVPHPQVSSAHAWIGFDGACVVYRDRGSTNGSTVNGVAIRAHEDVRLQPGDSVRLGRDESVSFVIERG